MIYHPSHHFRIADFFARIHISIAISSLRHIIYHVLILFFNGFLYSYRTTYFIELRTHKNGSILSPNVYFFLFNCTMYTVMNFHDLVCICT
ncbi:hypothetical protein BDR05DRAFT_352693 [Suillus weaverae]|nr:hypothetical protein BDR05DRAFT_352693 [Suillus weaverae]